MWGVPLFPEQASTLAGKVDALFFFLVGVSAFFSALIFFLIFYFAVKYRRRSEIDRTPRIESHIGLEVVWTAIPLGLVMVMFAWGARLYFTASRAPEGALEVRVVARQWMWKFQHPEGQREINELHVPRGQPVKMVMISEDVIHSFFVPAFRVKMDVLPGRTTTAWFEVIRGGTYHLFCAEYCGTQHSGMIGRVVVLEPGAYQRWLAAAAAPPPAASEGERLFIQLGCASCHRPEPTRLGPPLAGLYGRRVSLQSGESVIADEDYLREAILRPRQKLVAGYQPVMPAFQGLVGEEGLAALIAYIRSLGTVSSEGEGRRAP